MPLDLRLMAYEPNGAQMGLLPTPKSVEANCMSSDVGALRFAYDRRRAARTDILQIAEGSGIEVGVELSKDGGFTWAEPDSMRYLILRDEGNAAVYDGAVSFSGPSYAWRLLKAYVQGTLASGFKRTYVDDTPGFIFAENFDFATGRGALAGMSRVGGSTSDATATAWARTTDMVVPGGTTMLTLADNLVNLGLMEYRTRGRVVRIYNDNTVWGGSPRPTLTVGRDIVDAPYRGSREGLADHVYVEGDGAYIERDAAAGTFEAPWGRQEIYIKDDSANSTILTWAGGRALAPTLQRRTERTYQLDFSAAEAVPHFDYQIDSTVFIREGLGIIGALPARKVLEWTLTQDENARVGGNIVVENRFRERRIRDARKARGVRLDP